MKTITLGMGGHQNVLMRAAQLVEEVLVQDFERHWCMHCLALKSGVWHSSINARRQITVTSLSLANNYIVGVESLN